MKAIIMAGGIGSRLKPLTDNIPKPMVPIINKPVLQYIVELLAGYGIVDIAITLGYKKEVIINHFGDGQRFGVNIEYFIEDMPLGTAGGVKNAIDFIDDRVLVMSGDAYTDMDLEALESFHIKKKAIATIATVNVLDARGYGLLSIDSDGEILKFIEKPQYKVSGSVNTGIYILEKDLIEAIPSGFQDFGRNIFPYLKSGLYAYMADCYWSDIGTLSSYYLTNHYVVSHSPYYNVAN